MQFSKKKQTNGVFAAKLFAKQTFCQRDVVRTRYNFVEKKDWSFSSPQISEGGNIICVGYNEKPYKLGRIYCTNRPSAIFHSHVNNFPNMEIITSVHRVWKI